METTSVTPTPQRPAAPGPGTAAPPAPGNTAFSSDFETFLKMLTTQMRNQDPLNPVESSDFAVQLATFSTVEQQVLTNDLLTGLDARIGALGLGQVTAWIGMEAAGTFPVAFAGAPVEVTAHVDDRAQSAEIVATDAQGIVVNRQEIAARSGPVLWQGRDSAGFPLTEGAYTLRIDSRIDDTVIASHPVQARGVIAEARFEDGETRLVLDNGQDILASQVLGLRSVSE